MPQLQQRQILAASANYTAAYSNIGSLTHLVRPGIELNLHPMDTNRVLFLLFRAAPSGHVHSQARGQIGAIAAGLGHSHSNVGS